MCWEFLDHLGSQSPKPKHLKGKKQKRFPWVWGLRPQTQGNLLFFAFQMFRLSELAAQEFQELPTHAVEVLHIPTIYMESCNISYSARFYEYF